MIGRSVFRVLSLGFVPQPNRPMVQLGTINSAQYPVTSFALAKNAFLVGVSIAQLTGIAW